MKEKVVHNTTMAARLISAATILAALCAKHVRRASKKLAVTATRSTRSSSSTSKVALQSPRIMASSKQLLTTISNKATPFLHKKRSRGEAAVEEGTDDGFGDGVGLWQRDILLGEKCQPIEFSGAIFYDTDGKRVQRMPPRSPHASPLQSSFTFPAMVSPARVGD